MRLIGLFVCLAGLASAQAILEHAIAAGAGSVTGVAGKGLSQSIDTILGKTRGMLNKVEQAPVPVASKDAQPPASNAAPPVFSLPEPLAPLPGLPASIPPTAGRQLPPAPGQPAHIVSPAFGHLQALDSQTGRPAPTPDDVARIRVGTTREQLLTALGKPYSRVLLPSDEGFLEIYSYVSPAGSSGSVRLTDGTVSSVHPAISR